MRVCVRAGEHFLCKLLLHYPLVHVHIQIFNSHKLGGGKMGDYCDGEQYKQHPLFKDDPCALQIRLYYDDLEICNALGSKTKKHKLGKVRIQ